MVRTKRFKHWLTLGLLSLCVAMVGCSPVHPKTEQVKALISCQQAQNNNYATVSDQRLVQFLDQSTGAENLNQCWRPSMVAALEQQREIPQHHLVTALNVFNQRCDHQLFHLAIKDYLSTFTSFDYHAEQRQLLIAYSRYLIDHAQSNVDPRLAQIKVLCAELDQDLYHKLFE